MNHSITAAINKKKTTLLLPRQSSKPERIGKVDERVGESDLGISVPTQSKPCFACCDICQLKHQDVFFEMLPSTAFLSLFMLPLCGVPNVWFGMTHTTCDLTVATLHGGEGKEGGMTP